VKASRVLEVLTSYMRSPLILCISECKRRKTGAKVSLKRPEHTKDESPDENRVFQRCVQLDSRETTNFESTGNV
jgi:hypothetical protein